MKKYELYVFGGSIGEISADEKRGIPIKRVSGVGRGRLWGTYDTREEAKKAGESYIRSFSGGRKNYYKPRYRIFEIEEKGWEEDVWGVRE